MDLVHFMKIDKNAFILPIFGRIAYFSYYLDI